MTEKRGGIVAERLMFEKWLDERIDWLTKEAHSGGDWEHLNARRAECAYILEKFRILAAVQAIRAIAQGEQNARPSVTEGWVMVPREPTEEMMRAFWFAATPKEES